MSERERSKSFTPPNQQRRRDRGKNARARSVALTTLLAFAGCTSDSTSPADKAAVRGSGAPLGLAVQNPMLAAKSASKRVVWVVMKDQGNLTAAKGVKGWKARGQAVGLS